jgi:hypothetical protein
MDRFRRQLIIAGVALALIAGGQAWRANARPEPTELTRLGRPPIEITPTIRAAGLRFEPGVAPRDRAWILAAIAHARPEARRLVDEVDGLVRIGTENGGEELPGGYRAVGVTYPQNGSFRVVFNTQLLDGDAAFSRDVVVLHELGHVIDFSLITTKLDDQLDRTIPSSGPCISAGQQTGACTAPEERLADTFAKWALRGAVSAAGAGYGVDAPLLDEWALPLAGLAGRSAPAP